MGEPEITLDPSQAAAVELLTSAHVAVMTGGPGTGKTTTLRAVLDRLDAQGLAVKLCSPTGKAAKRMAESTGREASTIHRLLVFEPFTGGFLHNERDPLEVDAVIVDEASMMDIELFDALSCALPPHARLLLVGDADQLPSVGPGQVLADLVESEAVPVARLTTLHRSAQESWVCTNAPRLIQGVAPSLEPAHDFAWVDCDDSSAVRAAVVAAMTASPEAQVLTPQNTGECGTRSLNVAIQAVLNPVVAGQRSAKIGAGDDARWLRTGDRVIQTVNDYKLEVFNGEVGQVVDVVEGSPVVNFGDRHLTYGKGPAKALQLAYALTIHKSQGSEFDHVIVITHSTHTHMLARQLVYTGITRAKKMVTLVGNAKGIKASLASGQSPRNSMLIERMQGAA